MKDTSAGYRAGGGDSSYARRKAIRRSADGGSENPMPRPLAWDYFPKHTLRIRGFSVPPIPEREKKYDMTARELARHERTKMRTTKYDHHAMNYTGWNS